MNYLSVCMVVRDEEELLPGAIESILPYLAPEDELVIVDGGSNDITKGLAEEYQKDDCRIKIFSNPQDFPKREWKDEAGYRNKAYSFCKNDWILSHDADEAYSKEFYSRVHDLINQDQVKAFYFPTINFIGSTKKVIDLDIFPDLHIRLVHKPSFEWVGDLHASQWLKKEDGSLESINPNHKPAYLLPFCLYHYARVKPGITREYGEIPEKQVVDFLGGHPRKEFDE